MSAREKEVPVTISSITSSTVIVPLDITLGKSLFLSSLVVVEGWGQNPYSIAIIIICY